LIAMASYNRFDNNVMRDGILIPIINSATSLYAGCVVYSVLGFMTKQKGFTSVSQVVAQGPGLVFVVYPEGLSTMPLPQLWAVLFFLMMTFIGFSSQFSTAETIICAVQDEFPSLRVRRSTDLIFRGLFCLVCFLCGLPMVTNSGFYLFQLLNDFGAGYPLLTVGLLEVMALMYVYGYKRFADDVELMLGRKPWLFHRITWMVISPVAIAVIIACTIYGERSEITMNLPGEVVVTYPRWGHSLGWLIAAFPLLLIVLMALQEYCRKGGCTVLRVASRPHRSWGPALEENRTGAYKIQPGSRTVSSSQLLLGGSTCKISESKTTMLTDQAASQLLDPAAA